MEHQEKKLLLNIHEQLTLELCLSSVFNRINPTIDSIQKSNIDSEIEPQVTPLHLRGMDVASLRLFDQVLGHSYDIDQMLSFIQESKCNLSKEKKRASEQYIMLNIIERIVDNFDLWDKHIKNSELTFYRRFAEILDYLFVGASIKMTDGDPGSSSTKTAIEINKALFHTTENSPSYPRKIDLLLKLNETTGVDLSSSEWKRSSVRETLVLKQQVKNLKTNACILSTLRSLYRDKFNNILAMNWIGNVGYLYRLVKVNDVFVATQIDSLMIHQRVWKRWGCLKIP